MTNGSPIVASVFFALTFTAPVVAAPITFVGSSGNLAARVDFDLVGTNLVVRLTNTASADVTVPSSVLTAVFFNVAGTPALSTTSAVVAGGSSVFFGSTDPGGVVGGEMAYKGGLIGAPGNATYGISSVGLGLFGPGDRFAGNNLQGPASPNGLQYGLTSVGDDPATGNTPVTGTNALIASAVVFTLAGLPTGFMLDSISNVHFQYGTSLAEPSVLGSRPERIALAVRSPSTITLLGAGVVGMFWLRRRGSNGNTERRQ